MNSNLQPPNQSNPNHPIDHVLNALAKAEPPTGMDLRILNTLELHASAELESRLRARVHPCHKCVRLISALAAEVPVRLARSPLSRFAFAPALLASTTTVSVLLIVAILHRPQRHEPEIGPIANYLPATSHPLQIDAEDARKQHPMPLLNPPPAVHHLGSSSASPPPFRWVSTARLPHIPLLGRGISQTRPALPTQPTLVSYPAPPMPLTNQEKLLLRIAHKDDPQALAPLTPAGRAAEQAQENAAFQNFFPPPVPVDYPTLISQANPPAPASSRTHGASK